MRRILLAGASGHLGRSVLVELERRGYRVRALTRTPARLGELSRRVETIVRGDLTDQPSLRGVCDGVDVVLSCAGASMRLGDLGDRASFGTVDHRGNTHLLAEAQRSGAGKLIYISLFGAERLLDTEYAAAHERFVTELLASGMPHAVVRPSGLFHTFGEVLAMARRGRGIVIGSGETRTNPVHEDDVAERCVSAIDGSDEEIAVGGPDVLTRRRIVELAFQALRRPARITSAPPRLFTAAAALLRPVNRRLHALLEFGVAVSRIDVVAPTLGSHSLAEYFTELADMRRLGSAENADGRNRLAEMG